MALIDYDKGDNQFHTGSVHQHNSSPLNSQSNPVVNHLWVQNPEVGHYTDQIKTEYIKHLLVYI